MLWFWSNKLQKPRQGTKGTPTKTTETFHELSLLPFDPTKTDVGNIEISILTSVACI